MNARVLIWVQHLLGFGHFARARILSEALRDAGFAVTLVSGGVTPREAVPGGIAFVQLPAAKAKDELFDELVTAAGNAVDRVWHEGRRDALLDAFRNARPDAVITETFPFGRRLLEFELNALLDEASRASAPPKLIASVRDVLQRPRKDGRAAAMVQRARDRYDAILVHGDPSLVRLEESFAETAALAGRCIYTGYISADMPQAQATRREILVSAGGGAAGRHLIEAALEARKHSRLSARPWTFVTGPLTGGISVDGATVVPSLPDFRARLANAAVSISQAGYNTLIEAVKARTTTVAVPFETEREREQLMRAQKFAARGLIKLVRAGDLDPRVLARAVDEVADSEPPPAAIDFNGREGTVIALRKILSDG